MGGRLMILDLLAHGYEQARELYADLWLGFSEVELVRLLEQAGFRESRRSGRFERIEQSILPDGVGHRGKITGRGASLSLLAVAGKPWEESPGWPIFPMKKLLLLFVLSPLCLQAAWNVLDRRIGLFRVENLVASELRVTNGSADAEVNLVSFNPAETTLEVIENTGGQIRGLREAIEASGGVAGINGGYFEANLDPVGLLISNDRVVHRLQRAKLLSGDILCKRRSAFSD